MRPVRSLRAIVGRVCALRHRMGKRRGAELGLLLGRAGDWLSIWEALASGDAASDQNLRAVQRLATGASYAQ